MNIMTVSKLQAVFSKHGINLDEIRGLQGSYEARTDLPLECSRALRDYQMDNEPAETALQRNVQDWQRQNEARLRRQLGRTQTEAQMNATPFGHLAVTKDGKVVLL